MSGALRGAPTTWAVQRGPRSARTPASVIDVYQAWCGPCKAIQALFRKLRNELSAEEELLHFAVAEADSLISLQPFRDKCEPLFLFSLNGRMISMVKGANAPLLNAKVTQLVEDERKILAGEMERPVLPEILLIDSDEDEDVDEILEVPMEDTYNVMIIRPNAVEDERVEEIRQLIVDFGAVIVAEEQRILYDDQVRDFYYDISDKFDFEDFVLYATSNPSYILGISMGTPIKEIEEEEGGGGEGGGGEEEEGGGKGVKENKPEDDQAEEDEAEEEEDQLEEKEDDLEDKDESFDSDEEEEEEEEEEEDRPMSLREFLERQDLLDVCDLIDDPDQARRHIILFFPDFAKSKNLELCVERTLAIIRPDRLDGTMENVKELLQKEGFVIKMQKQMTLTEEEALLFYDCFKFREYFPALIEHVTSAPVVVLSLERANAVHRWRYILYPTADEEIPTRLRDTLGPENSLFNQLHGKDNPEAGTEETRFFFPFEYTVALIKPHAFQDLRGNIIRQIQEAGYSLSHMKEIQLTADKVATLYAAHKEKDFYEDLVHSMTEGPCMAMIIGKENALEDWRLFAGPTDPEEAKKVAPQSIRALFGKDILNNAVHVSSNKEHAMKTIELLFGDIDLDFEEGI